MTSKEMEARSGVPRANIRYYEAEGLLAPARAKNGYRVYSEADLALLEKIRLLRQLGVSVEELRALRDGTDELSAVLDRRLAELGGERENLTRVEQVCGDLREAGETFESLDAERYLAALDGAGLPEEALSGGAFLWRRLGARLIDEVLYLIIAVGIFGLRADLRQLLGGGGSAEGLVMLFSLIAVVLVSQWFTEPLFLHLFAATPGKALMGLRITRPDGTRLAYRQGMERLAIIFRESFQEVFVTHRLLYNSIFCGLIGAAYILMRQYTMLVEVLLLFSILLFPGLCVGLFLVRSVRGVPQPWDRGTELTVQSSGRRCVLCFLAAAAVLGTVLCQLFEWKPPNQGDLTVEEFAENFNQQIERMEYEAFGTLAPDGQWQDGIDIRLRRRKRPEVSIWDNMEFSYQMDGDRVTGVTIRCDIRTPNPWSSQRQKPPPAVPAAMAALGWGQEGAPRLAVTRKLILFSVQMLNMQEHTLRAGGMDLHSWSTPAGGGTVRYTCEISLAK